MENGTTTNVEKTEELVEDVKPSKDEAEESVDNVVNADGEHVEIKLFVGRVPQAYDGDALKPIFEEFGPVIEVAIIKDRATQLHKGSAFVRMASLTHADNAIAELNNKKVLESTLGPLQVRYAAGEAEKHGLNADGASGQGEAKLFVGCISKEAGEQEVRQIFEAFGTVREVFIMKDASTGASKGCSFVKFASKEQALVAINKLNAIHKMEGAARPLEVRFAESKRGAQVQSPVNPVTAIARGSGMAVSAIPFPVRPIATTYTQAAPISNTNPRQVGPWKEYLTQDGKCYYYNELTNQTQWERPLEFEQPPAANPQSVVGSDTTGPPGANVFVFHIPNDWGYNELLSTFASFGRIVSARLAIDRTSQRNKGFGFISYEDVNSAVQCVTQMNGCMVQNKRLKVTIKKGEEQHVAHLMPPAGSMATAANAVAGSPNVAMNGGSAAQVAAGQVAGRTSPQVVSHIGMVGNIPHMAAGPGQGVQQFQQQFGTYRTPNSRYSPY